MKNGKFNLIETPDGSLALYISEGVNSLDDLGYDAEFDRATAIHFPASMEEIPADLQWQFMNLEEYHVHPESPYFTEEDGVIFSKDKKKIIKYSHVFVIMRGGKNRRQHVPYFRLKGRLHLGCGVS